MQCDPKYLELNVLISQTEVLKSQVVRGIGVRVLAQRVVRTTNGDPNEVVRVAIGTEERPVATLGQRPATGK